MSSCKLLSALILKVVNAFKCNENIPILMFSFAQDRKKDERMISISTMVISIYYLSMRVTFRTHLENADVFLCIHATGGCRAVPQETRSVFVGRAYMFSGF